MEKEQYSADIVVRFLEGESFSKRDFVALLEAGKNPETCKLLQEEALRLRKKCAIWLLLSLELTQMM